MKVIHGRLIIMVAVLGALYWMGAPEWAAALGGMLFAWQVFPAKPID